MASAQVRFPLGTFLANVHIAGSAGLDVGLPDIPSSSHQIIARLIIVMELEEIIGNRAPRVGGGRALPRYSWDHCHVIMALGAARCTGRASHE